VTSYRHTRTFAPNCYHIRAKRCRLAREALRAFLSYSVEIVSLFRAVVVSRRTG